MNIFLIILVILAIPLIAALFLSNEYSIERDIVINRPKPQVFNYIKLVRNSENYSKWVMLDPAMKKEFSGVDGEPGFVYRWDSTNKNVGKGEQEITSLDDRKINYEIRFIKPFQ